MMSPLRIKVDIVMSVMQGGVAYWLGLQYDRVQYYADRDTLTHLYNRSYMMRSLAHTLQKTSTNQHTFSVIIADVNHLKWVNDTFGHLAGDELITIVSDIIGKVSSHGGIAGRLGGDEFLILYPMLECTATETIAISIEYELRHARLERAKDHIPSVSIGISSYPENGKTAHHLLKAADDRMYAKKAIHHASFAP